MNTTYYKIAYRKKNTGSIIDDTQTPFVALKNSWRYWVADPFVISRMGKTYIFAELYDYLRRKGCIVILAAYLEITSFAEDTFRL